MSTTQTTTDFVRQYREHRSLLESTQRALDEVAHAQDPESLRLILSTLGIPETPSDPKTTGDELQSRLRIEADKLMNNLVKLAFAAHHRLALVSETTTDLTLATKDFRGGTTVIDPDHSGKHTRRMSVGFVDRLAPDHPLRGKLPAVLPKVDGRRAVFMGHPVTSIDGRLVAAGSYYIGDVLALTRAAAEKERAEDERIAEENRKRDELLKEKYRTPTEAEKLRAEVDRIQGQLEGLPMGRLALLGMLGDEAWENAVDNL